ncbi:MAG: HEAT repeat domain-containing protein [Planctomycetota bacterium]|jgi:hypothetical protein
MAFEQRLDRLAMEDQRRFLSRRLRHTGVFVRVGWLAYVPLVLVSALPAFAEPALEVTDEESVTRAKVIVVARIKPGPVKVVEHMEGKRWAGSYEHHVTLIVDKVLKGSVSGKELPIVIHYGMDVAVSRKRVRDGLEFAGHGEIIREGAMEIYDAGTESLPGPLVPDARDPHLWFLRIPTREEYTIEQANRRIVGIVHAQDLQPLRLLTYFEAHLAQDPEAAVRRAFHADPSIGQRAADFLQRGEIRRIFTEPDGQRRAEKLLPYFTARTPWPASQMARDGLASCGEAAGPYLLAMLARYPGRDPWLRWAVIELLGKIRYRRAANTLISLLQEADGVYASLMKEKDWSLSKAWRRGGDFRRDAIQAAVRTLGRLGDEKAITSIQATRKRWQAYDWMVEDCDRALRLLRKAPRTRPGD